MPLFSLQLRGEAGACRVAAELLQSLAEATHAQTLTLRLPGISRFLLDGRGQAIVQELERRFRSVVGMERVHWSPLLTQVRVLWGLGMAPCPRRWKRRCALWARREMPQAPGGGEGRGCQGPSGKGGKWEGGALASLGTGPFGKRGRRAGGPLVPGLPPSLSCALSSQHELEASQMPLVLSCRRDSLQESEQPQASCGDQSKVSIGNRPCLWPRGPKGGVELGAVGGGCASLHCDPLVSLTGADPAQPTHVQTLCRGWPGPLGCAVPVPS